MHGSADGQSHRRFRRLGKMGMRARGAERAWSCRSTSFAEAAAASWRTRMRSSSNALSFTSAASSSCERKTRRRERERCEADDVQGRANHR